MCVVVVVTFVVCGVHLELGESNQHGRLDRGTCRQVIGTLVVIFKHVHSGVVAMDFSIIVRSRRIAAYKNTEGINMSARYVDTGQNSSIIRTSLDLSQCMEVGPGQGERLSKTC